jgi:hypothetical protein
MIAYKGATCSDIRAYNDAARYLFSEEVKMRVRLLDAGMSQSDLPAVPYPLLFGNSFEVIMDPSGKAVSIPGQLSCNAKDMPDYSKLKAWGPPDMMARVKSPKGGALQWAFLAYVPVWALDIIVLGALAYYMGPAIIKAFRSALSNEAAAKLAYDIRHQDMEQDARRADYIASCIRSVTDALPVSQRTMDNVFRISEHCHQRGIGVYPRLPHAQIEEIGGLGLGKTAIYVGVGALLFFGGLTIYKAIPKAAEPAPRERRRARRRADWTT